MIDLHSHVLPGLDDGPGDMAGSLSLARAAVDAGTRVLAATPHIGHRYDVPPSELAAHLAALREALDADGVPLEVVAGGEVAAGMAADLTPGELEQIALGGGSCILLECPFSESGGLMPGLAAHLRGDGFRVLLAHPERSPEFLREPALLAALIDDGAFVQITAGSLRGDFGRMVRRFALALLGDRLVHVVASDAHDAYHRSPELASIVALVARETGMPVGTTQFLTDEAPRALLDDDPVPRFPTGQRHRRRGLLRRR